MNAIKRIRQLSRAEPFQPFVILLSNGGRLAVSEPYTVAAPPGDHSVFISISDAEFHFLGARQIQDVQL